MYFAIQFDQSYQKLTTGSTPVVCYQWLAISAISGALVDFLDKAQVVLPPMAHRWATCGMLSGYLLIEQSTGDKPNCASRCVIVPGIVLAQDI